MERQRSFTGKSTRLLFFSFTVPASVLFCFLLYICVFYTGPSGSTGSHLQFSTGVKTLKAQSNFSLNGTKNPTLVETHLGEATNLSRRPLDLGEDMKDVILDSVGENAILSYRHLGRTSNFSIEVVDSADLAGTHIRKDGSVSSIMEIEAKSNDSDVFTGSNGKFDTSSLTSNERPSKASISAEEDASTCDVSDGRWVFDESYPLYTNYSCPFIDEGFNCESNGRMDRDYMTWRWQPNHCSIPRFNPVKMLEMIRGKRLVFVGDSINRNQWESMLCMLRGAVSDPRRVYEARGRRITKERGNYNFKFLDYQCSVEYYVTHFLVHEGKARLGQRRKKTLRIDTLDRSSSRWRGADILVFNTAHWWSHYKTKAGVNYYQEKDRVHPRLDGSVAFRKALMTWASWVDQHATPGKTQVFFRSSSPSHFRGGEWNSGGHCKEVAHPLNDSTMRKNPEKNVIVEEIIGQMKTPVTILNITTLSGLRIDGHPSIYGQKPGKGSSSGIQDCSHWCLPGVPDTWNELLYFYLLSRRIPVSTS